MNDRQHRPRQRPADLQLRAQPQADTNGQARQRRQDPGNAARQDQLRDTQQAPGPDTSTPDLRKPYRDYAAFLEERLAEIRAADTHAYWRRADARALLGQAVQVQIRLVAGIDVDVSKLDHRPFTTQEIRPGLTFPPEWVGVTRELLALIEDTEMPNLTGIDMKTGQFGFENNVGPWESMEPGQQRKDYGVPEYQTQSDNLASPEATCNGTSLAMVLERLGYDREDLISAIERKIDDGESAMSDLWKQRVRAYLDSESNPSTPNRGSAYQRLRAGADGKKKEISSQFRENARLDDLALFLIDLLDIERSSISVGNNAQKMVDAIHTNSRKATPFVERVDRSGSWANAKKKVAAVLEKGGAAMLSLHHKGSVGAGTHIVAVQSLTPSGAVLDDPYGQIRSGYTANSGVDAYAPRGTKRATSGLKNMPEANTDDWKRENQATATETRGKSSEVTDETLTSAWNYVLLFHKGGDPNRPTPAFDYRGRAPAQ